MSVKEVAFREWDTGKFREAKVLARRWEKLNNCDQNNCNTSSQPMTLALYGKGSERSPTANLQPHSTNDLGPANDLNGFYCRIDSLRSCFNNVSALGPGDLSY